MTTDVSVIIPARNRHELLARAISSVESQVGVNYEIIVVDDASSPPLADVIKESLSDKIRVLRNDLPKNAAFSRNRGAAVARSPYFAFLDSDDYWFPLHLKNALAGLERCPCNTLYVSRFGPVQDICAGGFTEHSDVYGLIFERIGDPRSSVLVCRKEFFEKVGGFDEGLEKYQDWDFALRCALNGNVVLGDACTAFLDSNADGRMSSRLDVNAARRFLAAHGTRMTEAHRVRFFVTLLRVASLAEKAQRREAVELFSEKLSLRSFPIRYWPLRLAPKAGRMFLGAWLYLGRSARLKGRTTRKA